MSSFRPTRTDPEVELPYRVIFERDESSALPTDSHGCVICPSDPGTCPTCKGNEVCQQRSPTCDHCATFYCGPNPTSSEKSTPPIGAIVGGVIGGVVVIALLVGLYYYNFIYLKRRQLYDDTDVMMEGLGGNENDDNSELSKNDSSNEIQRSPNKESFGTDATMVERPPTRRTNSNNLLQARKRLSSYESFTKPSRIRNHSGGAANSTAAQRRARQRHIVERANAANSANVNNANGANGANGVYINNSNRNSVATSISTTNASNILPIAYIPGVTVRPTINNTRSIYSYDTESVFSDLNTIENASIVGDVMKVNNLSSTLGDGHPEPNVDSPDDQRKNGTMTAIKAQPRLVNVDRIDEDDEDITDDEDEHVDDYDDNNEDTFNANSTHIKKLNSSNNSSNNNTTTLTNLVFNLDEQNSESESDSDVDSDIGEIARATSVRRNPSSNFSHEPVKQDREILLDVDGTSSKTNLMGFDAPGSSTAPGDTGSFVFDVTFDDSNKHSSETSTERSPFEDP